MENVCDKGLTRIRRRLGLSKEGLPRGVTSNILRSASEHASFFHWLMTPGSQGGLLEYASEPEDEETQKPKGRQGNPGPKSKGRNFLL